MKRLFFVLFALILLQSCTGEIKPVDKLDKLRWADTAERINETARCVAVHEEGNDLVIDSVKVPVIIKQTPNSVVFIPCEGYNGIWHSHPSDSWAYLSRIDAKTLLRTDDEVEYSIISIGDKFSAWSEDYLRYNRERARHPEFTADTTPNLKD